MPQPTQTALQYFNQYGTETQVAMFSGQMGADYGVDKFRAELVAYKKNVLPQTSAYIALGEYAVPTEEDTEINDQIDDFCGQAQSWIDAGRPWPVPVAGA